MTDKAFKQLQEKRALDAYSYAMRNAFRPAVRVTSRRSAKHNSVGKVFKNSRVVHEAGLETCLNKPGWTKERSY